MICMVLTCIQFWYVSHSFFPPFLLALSLSLSPLVLILTVFFSFDRRMVDTFDSFRLEIVGLLETNSPYISSRFGRNRYAFCEHYPIRVHITSISFACMDVSHAFHVHHQIVLIFQKCPLIETPHKRRYCRSSG